MHLSLTAHPAQNFSVNAILDSWLSHDLIYEVHGSLLPDTKALVTSFHSSRTPNDNWLSPFNGDVVPAENELAHIYRFDFNNSILPDNRALNISGSTDNIVNTTVTGSSGFIVKTAGDTVLTLNGGGSLTASDLNTKSLYEIGVARVSGSGNVEVLFP